MTIDCKHSDELVRLNPKSGELSWKFMTMAAL